MADHFLPVDDGAVIVCGGRIRRHLGAESEGHKQGQRQSDDERSISAGDDNTIWVRDRSHGQTGQQAMQETICDDE